MPRRSLAVTVGLLLAMALVVTLPASAAGSGSLVAELVPEPTTVRILVDRTRVGPEDSLGVTGRVLAEVGGQPLGGELLVLEGQRVGRTAWEPIGSSLSGPDGRVEWHTTLGSSTSFRVVRPESAGFAASVSPSRTVSVKPVVTVTLRRDWVRPGRVLSVRAQVAPGYEGEPLDLQQKLEGRWRTIDRRPQTERGVSAFRVEGAPYRGPQRYRVTLAGREHHLAAVSQVFSITTVRVVTYMIETRGKVAGALDSFVRRSAEIYADDRGWSRTYTHFKRVDRGGAFSLVLSQARYVPGFASICDRYWSCRVGRYVIINEDRWRSGTPYFKRSGGTLREYRAMVVNHETGHWLGLGHATCGGPGRPAPVMMQQSKGLYGCKPNPWPLQWEVDRAS